MFDPDLLDPEAQELWDEYFPDGLFRDEGPQFQLWSFGYICMLELGRVPDVVDAAIDPASATRIRRYKVARLAARRAR